MNRGFTLIELLVVIGIIALVAGMSIATVSSRNTRASDVATAAEELAATLRKARAMAIARRKHIGVAFHIQNGLDTSGRTLNNKDGGHYYRIISNPPDLINKSVSATDFYYRRWSQFPDILERIEEQWLTPPIPLPKGKVRFLALGDADEGDRQSLLLWRSPDIYRDFYLQDGYYKPYSPTYPRPYFGVFQNGRLYAWGGYDSDLTATRWCAGFFYQGTPRPRSFSDETGGGAYSGGTIEYNSFGRFLGHFPPTTNVWPMVVPAASGSTGWGTSSDENLTTHPVIVGCRNMNDRTTWYYPNTRWTSSTWSTGSPSTPDTPPAIPSSTSNDPSNANYCYVNNRFDRERWMTMPTKPAQVAYTIWKSGEPRPLVNSNWLDAVVLFDANGQASYPTWNYYRRLYDWAMPSITTSGANFAVREYARGGLADLAKPVGLGHGFPEQRIGDRGLEPEVQHFDCVTGSYYITLAPDAAIVDGDARHTFPNAGEALRSISPSYRVRIAKGGDVQVIPVRQAGDSALGACWPNAPSAWQDANAIRNNIPFGILIGTKGGTVAGPDQYLTPRAASVPEKSNGPITDMITPRMLTDQVWWRDE